MKGLIVNAMASALWGGEGTGSVSIGGGKEPVVDKKKEAIELVKRGLMMDMRCVLLATLLHNHCTVFRPTPLLIAAINVIICCNSISLLSHSFPIHHMVNHKLTNQHL